MTLSISVTYKMMIISYVILELIRRLVVRTMVNTSYNFSVPCLDTGLPVGESRIGARSLLPMGRA
jgi:hypothetical protein